MCDKAYYIQNKRSRRKKKLFYDDTLLIFNKSANWKYKFFLIDFKINKFKLF